MHHYEPIIGPNYIKINIALEQGAVELRVDFVGQNSCPHCGGLRLRKKDSFIRKIKHLSIGTNQSIMVIETHKFQCRQ